MSEKPSFFSELRRRNVYKVAAAYAVVGWLLVQIATQVFPFFDIPNWAVRLTVLAIIVGFPIALVIAWAFELTPEGVRRTEDVDRAPVPLPRRHVWIVVVIIGLLLSGGLFFLGRYTASHGESEQPSRGTAPLPAKSIALLPFENLSRDPDNAYFTEGIQDEILGRLAKIADLKVISRTSTQKYKSSPDDLPQIAKRLGVSNILEGSVQKTGDRVRVSVQLINATTDAHLWAETYDRNLTDVFATESEIAKTIADTLRAKLSGSEQSALAVHPTADPEAHQLYLRGRYFWNKRTGADFRKAIGYYNQAIDKDPNYALAYVGLADAYVLLSAYAEASPKESLPQAKEAAMKALELDPTLGEAHTALAQATVAYDMDPAAANREFQRAIELNPNYATAHHWYAESGLAPLGLFDEGIAEARRALELDPLSVIINADFGTMLTDARRYDEAIEQLRKTAEMDPGFYYVHWTLGNALELKGRRDEAIAEYKKAVALNDDPLPLALLGHVYGKAGRKEEALKILNQLRELRASSKPRYVTPYNLALVHLGLGQKDEVMNYLEETYEDRDGYNVVYVKIEPFLDSMRGYPPFDAFVEKVFPTK